MTRGHMNPETGTAMAADAWEWLELGALDYVLDGGEAQPRDDQLAGAATDANTLAEPVVYTLAMHHTPSIKLYVDASRCCGGHVWRSGLVLSRYIETPSMFPPAFWQGKRVIELGAGTGAVGIAAGLLGAHVRITDIDVMLPLMQRNAQANIAGACEPGSPVQVDSFYWGAARAADFVPQDVVLAADVIYAEEHFAALQDALLVLAAGGALILLAYLKRWGRDKKFIKVLLRRFDSCEVSHAERNAAGALDDIAGASEVHVYQLRHKVRKAR